MNYSVSLVYTRRLSDSLDITIRACICASRSKEEALGLVINQCSRELKGYSLTNHLVLDIDYELANQRPVINSPFPPDEEIPDEKTPPVEIITDDRHIAHAAEEERPLFIPPQNGEPIVEEKTGKRGPYKKNKKDSQVNLRYIRASDVPGKYLECLKGVQATPKKFISKNTYFHGNLEEAKRQYNEYAYKELLKLPEEILSWESWLVTVYSKQKL